MTRPKCVEASKEGTIARETVKCIGSDSGNAVFVLETIKSKIHQQRVKKTPGKEAKNGLERHGATSREMRASLGGRVYHS